ANDGKGGAIYTINNDVYLSDDAFNNNQAYTSTSYSDGDGGAIDVTDNSTGNDSNLLIVFYVQIMPDDLVMQLHR
ncbi:hypothetical protein QU988_38635, partial [Escherichia coli]|nr:hypothetical protein [Escherichia coli]